MFAFLFLFHIFFCFLDDFLKDLLWPTGVYGENWPKRTYLIASIKANVGKDIFNERFKNKHRQHAEKVMLRDPQFLDVVKKNRDIEITLTSNYSPCSECADNLKKFYEKYTDNIKNFTIQFSFIYHIEKYKNKTALQNLSKAGITLRAMNVESWREVGLDLTFYLNATEREKVKKRDRITARNLKNVLSEPNQDG